ncbi:hypothetical protein B0T19DRAFT_401905 [Cercophora scortea]|uniref:C2H2-type domain-containing protein n=1 Tax=Cercophora scortea TaxID=314031 RepID=A0AAE0IF52_9PEZI|nr:hypothetical protein B0T19DRAFT_401905 [Cercophora scortea]
MPFGSGKFECGTCRKGFAKGYVARDTHCKSTGHKPPQFECERCPFWFRDQAAADYHMRTENHWGFDCSYCPRTWPTQEECDDHESDEHGVVDVDTEYDFDGETYCEECNRSFVNTDVLRDHMKKSSRHHQGLRCLFCPRQFASAAAITSHLEAGGCKKAQHLNADELYRLIRLKDPQGIIANTLRNWNGSIAYMATRYTWNGDAYECYLCHAVFPALAGLNGHLDTDRLHLNSWFIIVLLSILHVAEADYLCFSVRSSASVPLPK